MEGKCEGKNNVPLENVLVKTKETIVQSTFTDSLGSYFFLINNEDSKTTQKIIQICQLLKKGE